MEGIPKMRVPNHTSPGWISCMTKGSDVLGETTLVLLSNRSTVAVDTSDGKRSTTPQTPAGETKTAEVFFEA